MTAKKVSDYVRWEARVIELTDGRKGGDGKPNGHIN